MNFLFLVDNRSRLSMHKTSIAETEIRSNQKTEVIRSRHRHITLMLLAVAAVFLLLTLPNSIYFVLDITYGFNKSPTVNDYYQWLRYRRLNILTVIMFQLSDLQHATNFFLYLLTSDKFRRSVVGILMSMTHILLTCSCKNSTDSKRYSNQKFDSSQYDKSCRFSVSNIIQSSANKQQNARSSL